MGKTWRRAVGMLWPLAIGLLSLFNPSAALAAAVDPNRADQAALETLPGIGPAKAQAILQYRQAHGPFRHLEDLTEVHGIGPKTLERLRPYLSLDADPGAAPSAGNTSCDAGKGEKGAVGAVIRDQQGRVRYYDRQGRPMAPPSLHPEYAP